MAIYYFTEETDFSLPAAERTTSWLLNILKEENRQAKTINYIFCSDEYLLALNKEYLNHDTYTDIITFDNTEEEGGLEADIFISVERVKENAETLAKPFEEELHRVMVHGLLHLLGYNDKTPDEKSEMRRKEDACLSLR